MVESWKGVWPRLPMPEALLSTITSLKSGIITQFSIK